MKKDLKDLNLLDRFLFAQAMEDPEIVENVLEIILGRDIVLKHLPQTEKENRNAVWSKQIKLDVWAMDEEDVIYDTEVQKKNTRNLPRRSRFYHGVIDSKLLEPGNLEYNQLNDVYIIMIMPFDLFGKGRYQYTFNMMCREVPGLTLEDGATRIFLNTRGTDTEGVSPELVALLKYFERTTREVAEHSASKKIRQMQQKIETIKSSEEMGVKLMNAWEEKILERQEAFEEGRVSGLAEGEARGRVSGLAEGSAKQQKAIAVKLKAKGMSLEEIAELTGLSEEEAAML